MGEILLVRNLEKKTLTRALSHARKVESRRAPRQMDTLDLKTLVAIQNECLP